MTSPDGMAELNGQSPANASAQRPNWMWRPLEAHELPYLQAFGRELRRMRVGADLTQYRLARSAALSKRQLERLEAGQSRTRRSTIVRLVTALDGNDSDVDRLVRLLGPTIAQESRTSTKGELKRYRKKRRFEQAVQREVDRELMARAKRRRQW